ncbi:MAG: hypothetical protein MZV63_15635 [Marinilabiliales bacterium]|nr:hypothetical protein [Marinilabiliales bacterium]
MEIWPRIIDRSYAGVWYGGVKGIPTYPVGITMQSSNPAGAYYIIPTLSDATHAYLQHGGAFGGDIGLSGSLCGIRPGGDVLLQDHQHPEVHRLARAGADGDIPKVCVRGRWLVLSFAHGYPRRRVELQLSLICSESPSARRSALRKSR